ncbi:MAG: glycosyltransferase family 4 protein [Micrococcaceae bacterium]
MRVLIVSQYFYPEDAGIPLGLAQSLIDRGHQVRVLTGFPNYPQGSLYEGYQLNWRQRKDVQGIDVLRVPLYPDHSQNPARRIANYLSFGLSSATARRFAQGADVVYVYATQMTAGFGPWLWRLLGGTPYVLHVQDLWPDSITGSTIGESSRVVQRLTALMDPWLKSVYRHASAIIGIAPSMVKALIERGSDPERTTYTFNWGDEDIAATRRSAPSTGQERSADPSTTEVVYAGNIGDLQDLPTAVLAAERLQDTGFRLHLVGDGVAAEALHALVRDRGITNVTFHQGVPREQMAEVYASADYSLVTLKDLPIFHGTIPSKFQSSVASGVPVISTVQGDLRALVEEHRVGFTADAEDVESLSEAFRRAHQLSADERESMATRAATTYREQFSREAAVTTIENILLQIGQRKAKS